MAGVRIGDVVFILFICGVIYTIMSLINRSRRRGSGSGEPVEAEAETTVEDDAGLRAILSDCRTVAMVGASANPARDSHHVMEYLLAAGYAVWPVNPRETAVLGQQAYSSLAGLPQAPQIVDVFRRAEEAPAVAREAVARGAQVLWLQEGVISSEAVAIARAGGLQVVMNRCLFKEHRRLLGRGEEPLAEV